MPTHILRFRVTDKDVFLDIKSGKKSVETRAATKKHKNIKAGDAVVFSCSGQKFEKTVKTAKIFKSIKLLVKAYPVKKIMPKLSTEKELEAVYYSFGGYKEKIKEFGLIALEFK